jgi:hypothetical protein
MVALAERKHGAAITIEEFGVGVNVRVCFVF